MILIGLCFGQVNLTFSQNVKSNRHHLAQTRQPTGQKGNQAVIGRFNRCYNLPSLALPVIFLPVARQ